jgi:flagella basal body P-ring formation protein FlgA
MPGLRRLLLIVLGLAGLAGPLRADGTAVIYLRSSALLHSAECTLGELAAIVADTPAEQERLTGLSLGRTLRGPALLSPGQLRRRIAAEYGGRVDLIGGRVAVIPEHSVPAGQVWFFFALLGFLDRLDGGPGGLELELLTRPLLPSEPVPVEFELRRETDSAERLAGRVQVSYSVGGGETPDKGGLLLWIHNYLPVARAARDLPRGRVLEESDVEYAETDVSQVPSPLLAATNLTGAWRTLTPIAQGQLLESARLTRELWVKTGDTVSVVFVRPGLSVTVPGRAFGSGGPGEPVEVRLRGSSRRFQARITGVREVLVEGL